MIEQVTGQPLDVVFRTAIFVPLNLKHTWLLGFPREDSAQYANPAQIFDGGADITRVRSNSVYWADGGIVSTADDMVVFLTALNEGRIVDREMLAMMHDWHKMKFPLQYGLGTMLFSLPQPVMTIAGLTSLWGHSGSTGSFLYYSEDMDLYMAGTIDQTQGKAKPFFLIREVLKAARASGASR